jgi:hypothetical protein
VFCAATSSAYAYPNIGWSMGILVLSGRACYHRGAHGGPGVGPDCPASRAGLSMLGHMVPYTTDYDRSRTHLSLAESPKSVLAPIWVLITRGEPPSGPLCGSTNGPRHGAGRSTTIGACDPTVHHRVTHVMLLGTTMSLIATRWFVLLKGKWA